VVAVGMESSFGLWADVRTISRIRVAKQATGQAPDER
jgi:hypothetical protein